MCYCDYKYFTFLYIFIADGNLKSWLFLWIWYVYNTAHKAISYKILQLLDSASVFENIWQLFILSYIIDEFCFVSFLFLMS